jgi:hypothetical protein
MTKSEDKADTFKAWPIANEIELVSRLPYSNSAREIIQHQLEYPDWAARMATIMVERWGPVTAMPDGEDSSGRSKLRMATPEELVARAVDTAEKLVATLRERGHVSKLPTFGEMQNADKP